MATLSAGTDSSAVGLRQTMNYSKTHTYYYTQSAVGFSSNFALDTNPALNIDPTNFNPITLVNTNQAFSITNPEPAYPMVVNINVSLAVSTVTNSTTQAADYFSLCFRLDNPVTFTNAGVLPGCQTTYIPALSTQGWTGHLQTSVTILLNSTKPTLIVQPLYVSTFQYVILPYTSTVNNYTSIEITTSW